MRQIVLDTETTGLEHEKGHRIIEIGCLELIDRQLTGNYFHQYIHPEREIENDSHKVHGITLEFLIDKPKFNQIMVELLTFLDTSELIIHNAPFDLGFLNSELQRCDAQKKLTNKIFDTLPFARKLHPGQRNNLDALCKRYQINNSRRKFHGALLDAELLAYVYLAMTGGQMGLFSEELHPLAVDSLQNNHSAAMGPDKNWSIPIKSITKEELQLHQAYLEKMKQMNKTASLWEQLTDKTEECNE